MYKPPAIIMKREKVLDMVECSFGFFFSFMDAVPEIRCMSSLITLVISE